MRPGMSVAAASALAPQLKHRPRDPAVEAAALAAIATWAIQFTPLVCLEPPGGLLLEIEGSLKLLGGIDSVLASLERGLQDMGYTAAIACAATATAAWLLARNGGSRIAIGSDALEPVVAALPVTVLDCDTATRSTFEAIGVKRIGDLLRLPRDGLARRCGPYLLDTLDRALGKLPEARQAFTQPARFEVKLEFAAEVTHSEALLFTAKRQLTQLAGFLAARNAGIQHFTLTLLHGKDHAATVIEIGLVAPTRDVQHLMLLTRERLAALALHAPVRALQLAAGDIFILAAENYSLFQDRLHAPGEWQKLVERLRARLGEDAVYGIAACPDHRPEHAWYATQPGTGSQAIEAKPRPLWLIEPPQPLRMIAARPHYREAALALVAGPERIESGWWDGADAKRDYFIPRTPACATLWIYRERREPCRWYLHGIFG